MPRLSIFHKGLLLIAVPVLLLILLVSLLSKGQADLDEAQRWALHTQQVMNQARFAFRLLLEEHARTRGLVITGDLTFDAHPDQGVPRIAEELEKLKQLVSDNPSEVARVERMQGPLQQFGTWVAMERKLTTDGNQAEAIEHIRDLSGKQLVDAIKASVDEFIAQEQQLDDVRMKTLAAARSRLRWTLGLATLASIVAAGLTAWLFSRGISSRLATLTRNAERLASGGQLAALVPGTDEIARLDHVLHDTAGRLAEAQAAEARYKGQLETRAAELAQANADLRKQRSELAHANESLQQQTRENEMFVYSVSHDLRSPLVNLQGFSKELSASIGELTEALESVPEGTTLPETTRKRITMIVEQDMTDSLRFILTAVSRSGNIIDALLRLSRAGRVEYRWQRVDVAATARRIADAMQVTLRQKNAQVVFGELPAAWGDPTAIEQVLGNLMGNAANYLAPERPGRIEVGCLRSEESPVGFRTYFVKDNGLGIPAAYLPKMFVAFQRLHGEVAKGEGIGLALVRRTVERHGGRAWVESTEGVGTTFFVSLPTQPLATGPVLAPSETIHGAVVGAAPLAGRSPPEGRRS